HQRRLARAVLAQQCGQPAATQRQPDPVQSFHAGKGLGDATGFQQDVTGFGHGAATRKGTTRKGSRSVSSSLTSAQPTNRTAAPTVANFFSSGETRCSMRRLISDDRALKSCELGKSSTFNNPVPSRTAFPKMLPISNFTWNGGWPSIEET